MNMTNTASIITVSAIAVIVFVFLTLFFIDVTGMFVGTIINSFCGIYFILYHSYRVVSCTYLVRRTFVLTASSASL